MIKEYNMLGSVLGSPHSWKPPCEAIDIDKGWVFPPSQQISSKGAH